MPSKVYEVLFCLFILTKNTDYDAEKTEASCCTRKMLPACKLNDDGAIVVVVVVFYTRYINWTYFPLFKKIKKTIILASDYNPYKENFEAAQPDFHITVKLQYVTM